jgi:hypothetical protein
MPLGVHSGSVPTLLASAIFSNGDNVLILSIAKKMSSHKGFVPLIPVPSLQGLSLPTPQVIGDAFTGLRLNISRGSVGRSGVGYLQFIEINHSFLQFVQNALSHRGIVGRALNPRNGRKKCAAGSGLFKQFAAAHQHRLQRKSGLLTIVYLLIRSRGDLL